MRDERMRELDQRWTIQVRRFGGWLRPWHAFIIQGIACLGEPGSTTYASRTPEAALRKALRTVAKIAPDSHPDQLEIRIEVDPGGAW